MVAVTMQDVARLAGVSAKTVSNVVNGHPNVTPRTRDSVQRAIEKLGYEMNAAARSLRTGRTGLVTLALPELNLPYFAELAGSIIAEAEKLDMRVLIETTNADRAREIDVLHGQRPFNTDGLIFSPLALGQDDIALFNVSFPMVLLGERVFGSANDHITMSNVQAAKAATLHLIEQGCQRVAVIGSSPDERVGSAPLREQGFRLAMAEASLPVDERLVRPCVPWHRHLGAQATDELVDSGLEFDAVFALNDAVAMGVLHSLHSHRIDVPSQVAVIGFDDIDDASFMRPTLTSVAPGREQIARKAVELLAARIAETGKSLEERAPVQRIYADFEIKKRESTGRS